MSAGKLEKKVNDLHTKLRKEWAKEIHPLFEEQRQRMHELEARLSSLGALERNVEQLEHKMQAVQSKLASPGLKGKADEDDMFEIHTWSDIQVASSGVPQEDMVQTLDTVRADLTGEFPVAGKLANQQGPQQEETVLQIDPRSIDGRPRRKSLLDENASEFDLVPFIETVWNMVLVCGHTGATYTDVAVSLFLLVLNIFMQVSFIFIVQTPAFLGDPMESQKGMATAWRASVAHDHVYMNFAQVSLATRVCAGDGSLIYSTSQSSLIAAINSYLGLGILPSDPDYLKKESLISAQGPLLCMLCILLWLLYMCNEFRSNYLSVEAILQIPRASRTLYTEGRIMALSWGRLTVFIILRLVRTGICAMLLYAGIQWLAATTSTQDLILNAVALGAILDIDSIVFSAMMPIKIQLAVQGIEAIKVKYSLRRSMIEGVFLITFTTAVAMLAFYSFVQPLTVDMQEVKARFCDGQQNFVVAQNTDTQILYAMQTNNEVNLPKSVMELAVEDAVHVKDWSESLYLQLSRNFDDFQTSRTVPMETYASASLNANPASCIDANFSTDFGSGDAAAFYQEVARNFRVAKNIAGRAAAAGCASLLDLCGSRESRLLRLICPETCGCTDPIGDRMYRVPTYGCKQGCKSVVQSATNTRACVDMRNPGAGWNSFWDNWVLHHSINAGVGENSTFTQQSLLPFANAFKLYGCDVLVGQPIDWITGERFCEGGVAFGHLNAFCPGPCLCRVTPSDTCSSVCRPCEDAAEFPEMFAAAGLTSCSDVLQAGHCKNFPEPSMLYCYKTCGFCSCADANPEDFLDGMLDMGIRSCSDAQTAGLCSNEVARQFCSSTCGVCPSSQQNVTSCEDTNFGPGGLGAMDNCTEAAAAGWCADVGVQELCAVSCGLCGVNGTSGR